MSYATIEEYKSAIDNLWAELIVLEGELGAIISTQDVSVDLTKSLSDFLALAEQKFAEKKATYEGLVQDKNQEMNLKAGEISALLDECKRFLFDDNAIVYNHP